MQLDNETKDNVIFRFCHHSFLYFDWTHPHFATSLKHIWTHIMTTTISIFEIFIFICKKERICWWYACLTLAAIPWYFTKICAINLHIPFYSFHCSKRQVRCSNTGIYQIKNRNLTSWEKFYNFFFWKNSKWWFNTFFSLMATILWFVNILYDCIISCIIIALGLRIWLHIKCNVW